MGYDLFLWPIDQPITYEQASETLERMLDDEADPSTDASLESFVREMQRRFPEAFPDEDAIDEGWQPTEGSVFFEMNLGTGHVFLGIPFGCVARVGAGAQAIGATHDLVIFDPQAQAVILPPRFGGAEVEWGMDPTPEEMAAERASWLVDVPPLDPSIDPDDFEAMNAAMVQDMAADGFEMWSPMGFQLTRETINDIHADPTRVPPALQTPDRKVQLLADMQSPRKRVRSTAMVQLTGWDPDPDVASVLRGLLTSDDEFVRWQAASGLARQGDTSAFEDVLEVLRRASPAAGGSVGGMLMPVQSALSLAGRIGPDALERVRRLATEWRGSSPSKPKVFDHQLDELLAE